MALYWHPFLAELLRQDYGSRLIVEEEVPLGDMPLRADLLLIRRDPAVSLPFPFDGLGPYTLVEYKSPDDTATYDDLVKLEIYGLLYALREGIVARSDVTLWLVASRFHRQMSRPGGATLVGMQHLGSGVERGVLDGFPTAFIDLRTLPVEPATLPLLMVARGPQEQQLVEFLIDHFRAYPRHVRLLRELHADMLREVLAMRQLTPEQIGLNYRALLDLIGEERAIDLIGEERLIADLMRRKGADWMRAALARLDQRPDAPVGEDEADASTL